jgi:hypothetical protein
MGVVISVGSFERLLGTDALLNKALAAEFSEPASAFAVC